MDIDKYSVSLKELIDHDDKFYAHSNGNRVETINEHIKLCIKYLKRIVSIKNIDGIITKIIQSNLICKLKVLKNYLLNYLLIRSYFMILVKLILNFKSIRSTIII